MSPCNYSGRDPQANSDSIADIDFHTGLPPVSFNINRRCRVEPDRKAPLPKNKVRDARTSVVISVMSG